MVLPPALLRSYYLLRILILGFARLATLSKLTRVDAGGTQTLAAKKKPTKGPPLALQVADYLVSALATSPVGQYFQLLVLTVSRQVALRK